MARHQASGTTSLGKGSHKMTVRHSQLILQHMSARLLRAMKTAYNANTQSLTRYGVCNSAIRRPWGNHLGPDCRLNNGLKSLSHLQTS